MLQDVMEKVNEAETQAREIVSSANRQAAEIVEDAKIKARESAEAAKAKAQEQAKGELDRAQKQGEAEKADYIAKVNEELKQWKQQVLQKENIAVEALVKELL